MLASGVLQCGASIEKEKAFSIAPMPVGKAQYREAR
jgi:hypothetical protein